MRASGISLGAEFARVAAGLPHRPATKSVVFFLKKVIQFQKVIVFTQSKHKVNYNDQNTQINFAIIVMYRMG